jgi:hypothetical protein
LAASDQTRIVKVSDVLSVDEEHGIVIGWAIVCKINGEPYYDQNVDIAGPHVGKRVPEHITEDAMFKCAADAVSDGLLSGNEMHRGPDVGHYSFLLPLTTDIAKALDITTKRTGLIVGYKPNDADVLAKFKNGTYKGFSIEGDRVSFTEEEYEEAA